MIAPTVAANVFNELVGVRHRIPLALDGIRQVLPKARAYYGCSYPGLALRAMILLSRRFRPEEAFRLGLFDPSLEAAALSSYLSKSALKRIQKQLNLPPWDRLVEDKGIFYRRCRNIGLPTPELYAIVYRNRPGWTGREVPPRCDSEWEEFLESELPSEFIVKPACGVYGRGVALYTRSNGEFKRSTGGSLDAAGLLRSMRSDPKDRGFIIQEHLRSHPEIAGLSGSEALQTIRIDVVSTATGPRIISAALKVIRGTNIVDNLDNGATGNFIVRISLSDGRLLGGRIQQTDRPGLKSLSHHPQTGKPLTGMTVPFWREARDLALGAMDLFRPLQAIGWDIAVTAQGVKVIEGNAWFDPAVLLQGRIVVDQRADDPAELLSRLYGASRAGSDPLRVHACQA